MRIFAVRDENKPNYNTLAYLFFYERANCFCIELPDDADPWDTPLILSSFLARGEKTVDAYWSRIWVRQRIVPPERQNIGQILKDNGLDAYDEFQLLCLSDGRCAQDDCYIAEIGADDLPAAFANRFAQKVEDVVPLSGMALLIFFRGGETKRCSLAEMVGSDPAFSPLQKNDAWFQNVAVQPGGNGVWWGELPGKTDAFPDGQPAISCSRLYAAGCSVPLTREDFAAYVQKRLVTSAEAAGLLGCSKQNIEDLTRRGKLHPIRETPRSRLYRKSEVMQRLTE